MVVTVSLVLTIAALVVLAWPVLRRGKRNVPDANPIEELWHERNNLYEEARHFLQDFELGHFSEEEYDTKLRANRFRAAVLLRQQDEWEAIDQMIEREILSLRESPADQIKAD